MVFQPDTSLSDHQEAPTPDKEVSPQDLENMTSLDKLLHFVKENNWSEAMGAVMALYTELFGTEEEKKKLAEARREAKEDQTKENTQSALDELSEDVDKSREDKEAEEKEDEKQQPPEKTEPTFSSKAELEPQIQAMYAECGPAAFTVANLHEMFRNPRDYIIHDDPVTGEKITFLGRKVSGGINMIMLPYLKMAEEELRSIGLQYEPQADYVLGYQDRNMKLRDQGLSPNIPSFHKFGLAIDIDPNANGPEDGRGNIPDQVIMAMARAGFTCGLFRTNDAYYLGQDPMHFQLEYPPDSSVGRRIIGQSEIGRRYMAALQPMTPDSG